MFRNTQQRWLVVQTLLGLFGAAHWITIDDNEDAPGGFSAEAFKKVELAASGGANLGLSHSEDFVFRLAASLVDRNISVQYWRGLEYQDDHRQRAISELMGAVTSSGDRAAIDRWLERWAHMRQRQSRAG